MRRAANLINRLPVATAPLIHRLCGGSKQRSAPPLEAASYRFSCRSKETAAGGTQPKLVGNALRGVPPPHRLQSVRFPWPPRHLANRTTRRPFPTLRLSLPPPAPLPLPAAACPQSPPDRPLPPGPISRQWPPGSPERKFPPSPARAAARAFPPPS